MRFFPIFNSFNMVNIERQCFTSTQKARTLLYMSASKIKPDLGSRDRKQSTQSRYLAYSSPYRCSHPCSIFSDICNPCGLARNENSWALPQTSWIRNSGGRTQASVGACPAGESAMGYVGEPWLTSQEGIACHWIQIRMNPGEKYQPAGFWNKHAQCFPTAEKRFMERAWLWKNEKPMAFCFKHQENWKKKWSLQVWVYSTGFYTPTN